MEALNIFPITIYKTEISNNDYLKNLMLSEILEASEHLSPPVSWFTNNLKTSFEGEPEGMEVIDKYRSTLEASYSRCLDEFFDKAFRVRLVDDAIWYNVYTDGEYQELHDHIPQGMNPFHWSCIHFLSYDKTIHNPPEFRDPIAQTRQFGVPMERDRVNEYYAPRVEEGSFLMFPTYLQHRVSSCIKSDYPRVTLSFNLRVLEYGNKRFKLD